MPNSKPAGFQPKYIRKINSLKGIFLFLLLHRSTEGYFCQQATSNAPLSFEMKGSNFICHSFPSKIMKHNFKHNHEN